MFIRVQRIQEGSFAADHLANPVNPNNVMVLGFYRNYIGTAISTGYSKKAAAIYFDTITGKQISRRKWTSEMESYAAQCERDVRPAPYKFKLTIIGYIFLLGFIALFAYLVYDSVKPPHPDAAAISALKEPIQGGDRYFGRYSQYDPGSRIPKRSGFGWFKVVENGSGNVLVSLSSNMSSHYKPSADLDSESFEDKSIPMKVKAQENYQIDLVTEDGTYEMSFTEKK